LAPKSVTFNDLERRNGRYFALLHPMFTEFTDASMPHRKAITSVSKELIRRRNSEREFFYNHIVQYFKI